jgi:hypothetical protein
MNGNFIKSGCRFIDAIYKSMFDQNGLVLPIRETVKPFFRQPGKVLDLRTMDAIKAGYKQ